MKRLLYTALLVGIPALALAGTLRLGFTTSPNVTHRAYYRLQGSSQWSSPIVLTTTPHPTRTGALSADLTIETPGIYEVAVTSHDSVRESGLSNTMVSTVLSSTPLPPGSTPTSTGTATRTPTWPIGACVPGTGVLTCNTTGDQWGLNSETMGQRINAIEANAFCALSAQLMRVVGPTPNGTIVARIHSDLNGAKGPQLGLDSMPSSVSPANLTLDIAGQPVAFIWLNGCPVVPPGPFWLNVVRLDGTVGEVGWKSGGTGACAGGVDYDAEFIGFSDRNQDFVYTLYTGGCGPTPTTTATRTPTRTSTRTRTRTPVPTLTNTLPPPTLTPVPPPTLFECSRLDLNGDGSITQIDVDLLTQVANGQMECMP